MQDLFDFDSFDDVAEPSEDDVVIATAEPEFATSSLLSNHVPNVMTRHEPVDVALPMEDTGIADPSIEFAHGSDEDTRKSFIIKFMRLGMTFDSACIAAEVHEPLKTQLLEDEEFQQRIAYETAIMEAKLLERLSIAADRAAMHGNSKATERLLAILRPDKYGTTRIEHDMRTNKGGDVHGIEVKFVGADEVDEQGTNGVT